MRASVSLSGDVSPQAANPSMPASPPLPPQCVRGIKSNIQFCVAARSSTTICQRILSVNKNNGNSMKLLAVLLLAAFLFVSTGNAATAKTGTAPPVKRLSASPYIFTTSPTEMTRIVRSALKDQFGKFVDYSVTCRGMFPGTHSGTHGFHEIRCPFSASVVGVERHGTAVYWIDGKKHVQDRIYSSSG